MPWSHDSSYLLLAFKLWVPRWDIEAKFKYYSIRSLSLPGSFKGPAKTY